MRRLLTGLSLAVLLAGGLAGCSEPADQDVIALLLPDNAGSTRWEAQDRPAFEAAVEARCEGCVVTVLNAGGDAIAQRAQFDEVRLDGVDVIVLAAVDSDAGESMVEAAGSIPVIAYDRFIAGADFYVSYDGSKVGTLQAEALLAATGKRPSVLRLNGAAGDPNASALRLAVTEVFESSQVEVLAETDPLDWRADTAQAWVAEQLKALKGEKGQRIDAVYAANDAQAGGVVAAFRSFGAADRQLPVLTGQDAELEALRRIVAGEQTMTVYKSIPDQAGRAARMAVSLVAGNDIAGTELNEGVPSVIFAPVPVTIENLTDTVVRDGVVTIEELCAGELLETCQDLGIA